MDKILQAGVVALALLGFIGWLGGGRKWAFRTMLSVLMLLGIGAIGTLLYVYWTDKAVEHRAERIHDCAIAKLANPKCEKPVEDPNAPKLPKGFEVMEVCPLYALGENPSMQQEEEALTAAEQECRAEMDPKERSLHEQIADYKRQHGIKEKSDETAKTTLNVKECAAKVRSFYPHSYNDLSDQTLIKKVLAKYPEYCDVASSPPTFIPDLSNIR